LSPLESTAVKSWKRVSLLNDSDRPTSAMQRANSTYVGPFERAESGCGGCKEVVSQNLLWMGSEMNSAYSLDALSLPLSNIQKKRRIKGQEMMSRQPFPVSLLVVSLLPEFVQLYVGTSFSKIYLDTWNIVRQDLSGWYRNMGFVGFGHTLILLVVWENVHLS